MKAPGAVLLCWIAAAGPAYGDEAAATDQFLNFASNGCINAIASGGSIKGFAAQAQLPPADESLAGSILGKEKGTVYFKDDARYPAAIAERAGGHCTVNAKFPGDIPAMIDAVTDYLGGPGGGFHVARTFEEDVGAAGWTTHHVFVGQRRGKKMRLLFSTTPGADTMEQIFFAAAESKE